MSENKKTCNIISSEILLSLLKVSVAPLRKLVSTHQGQDTVGKHNMLSVALILQHDLNAGQRFLDRTWVVGR